mgnify:CR=1 FL=1
MLFRSQGVGLFYPSNGIVIFNAIQLDKIVGVTTNQQILNRKNYPNFANSSGVYAGIFRQNYYRLYTNDFFKVLKKSKGVMGVRKSEFVPSTNYFVRVKNKEFNYSNNPTFVSDGTDGKTKGTIIYQDLINNPKTYLTSVGLYNDNNELLAIGKLSKPTQKSFDNELLIKVRIDF